MTRINQLDLYINYANQLSTFWRWRMNQQFWKSFDVVNEIADEIGIDREICQSALTEVQVSYIAIEENKKQLINQKNSTQDTTKILCNLYFNRLFKGVHLIWEKFPSESILVKTKMTLIEFANANHLGIAPSPKVDHASSNSEAVDVLLMNEEESIAYIGIGLSYDYLVLSLNVQCRLSGKSIEDVCKDIFSLGYIFGYVNMAYYQHGGDLEDSKKAMLCLLWVFKKLVPENAKQFHLVSIESQDDTCFNRGREIGAKEYGDYIRSKGEYTPKGLAS
jgi:hypothetical protein